MSIGKNVNVEVAKRPDDHYRVSSVAELLDVSTKLVRKLIRDGELKAVRVGRVFRVAESEIERFLEANPVEYA